MPTARLRSGHIVEVPDGLDKAGAQQYLLENGASYEDVGLPPPPKREMFQEAAAGFTRNLAGGVQDYLGDRFAGLKPDQPSEGMGGFIGKAAIPTGVGMLIPGPGWGGVVRQAIGGGLLEALRPEATASDIGIATGASGLGALVGNMSSRVVTGIKRAFQAAKGGTYLPTTSETARTLASTMGGRAVVDKLNRKALTGTLAESFGQKATELTPDVLRAGATDLGAEFNRLVPKKQMVDMTQPMVALNSVSDLGPEIKSLFPKNPTQATGQEWQDLRAAIQRRIQGALGEKGTLVQDLGFVQNLMDTEAEKVIGPTFRPEFRRVRELWKNLKVAEELGSTRAGKEYVTAAGLHQKLAQKYDTTFLRDSGGVLPETQKLFDMARVAAKDQQGLVANSGTATRTALTGGAAGLVGLLTGATSPVVALTAAGGVGASHLAGLASVGREVGVAAGLGAGPTAAAAAELERQRKASQ